jgi:predicted ATPase
MAEDPQVTAPNLKITGLHIAGYRSIKHLDLPADGIGWAGQVPDIIMVGGANGSGKTTLLEALFSVFAGLQRNRLNERTIFPGAEEFRLDLSIRSEDLGARTLRLALGREDFLKTQSAPDCYAIDPQGAPTHPPQTWREFLDAAINPVLLSRGKMPRVLYFPTDRQLTFPTAAEKSIDRPPDPDTMTWRFRPAETYKESLINQLTWARFEDLNDTADGHPETATRFHADADAFSRFVDRSKELMWHRSNLRVRTADGTLHGLPELSSGEKQVLIFAAELRRHWTPGSLVLIDEPELHLHAVWQSTLYELIRDLQRERGGQAILATQSHHLFGLGDPGTKVVMRKDWP